MREEIKNEELEKVVGGTVRLSGNTMRIAFTTLKAVYPLKNCTYQQALLAVDSLLEQNRGIGNAAYDEIVYEYFLSHNWI